MNKLLFLLFFFSSLLYAAEEMYPFTDTKQATQFSTLTSQLRCVVCQNQNLAESNSGIANDLRGLIYQHVQKGESNQQIIEFVVQRYGNFVLYKPPINASTLLLWCSPLVFLLFALVVLIRFVASKR